MLPGYGVLYMYVLPWMCLQRSTSLPHPLRLPRWPLHAYRCPLRKIVLYFLHNWVYQIQYSNEDSPFGRPRYECGSCIIIGHSLYNNSRSVRLHVPNILSTIL